MQKWMIAGIVLLTSGCSKSEEDKCKDKGKYWYESTKECKDEAPEGTTATPGGTTATPGGTIATPVAETQESCKSKAGYVWNAGSSQCKKVDYFMLIHPEDISVRRLLVQLKKPDDLFSSGSRYVERGECVKIPASSLPYLTVKAHTPTLTEACSNSATAEKKCAPGVYQLILKGDNNDQLHLQSVALDAERTDCDLLEMNSDN